MASLPQPNPAASKILLRSSNPVFLSSNRSLLLGDIGALSRNPRRLRQVSARRRSWYLSSVKAALDLDGGSGASLKAVGVSQMRKKDDLPIK